jgi:hypothetical protein
MWMFEMLCLVVSPFAAVSLIIIGLVAWRTRRTKKDKSVISTLLLLCFAPIGVVLLFNGIRLIDIPRDEKQHSRIHSPNSPIVLVVTTWVRFPMDELIDPELSVRFRLMEDKTNRIINEAREHLTEASDFENPVAEWTDNSVNISGFDNRRTGYSLVLPLNQ